MSDNSIPIYIFAKSPVPGTVKTRLSTHSSDVNSAKLAEKMLWDIVEKLISSWGGEVVLAVWPDQNHPFIQQLQREFELNVICQSPGNLGDKMMKVLRYGIETSGAAAVIGSDIPHIDFADVRRSYQLLKNGENIVGPAKDGGFYLMGLSVADPELYRDVEWGEQDVLKQIYVNADTIGLRFQSLPVYRDIDRWQDLVWLAKQNSAYNRFVHQSGIQR